MIEWQVSMSDWADDFFIEKRLARAYRMGDLLILGITQRKNFNLLGSHKPFILSKWAD